MLKDLMSVFANDTIVHHTSPRTCVVFAAWGWAQFGHGPLVTGDRRLRGPDGIDGVSENFDESHSICLLPGLPPALIHWPTHLPAFPLTHSLIHVITHSRSPSPTHPTHTPTHLSTSSLYRPGLIWVRLQISMNSCSWSFSLSGTCSSFCVKNEYEKMFDTVILVY